MVRPLMPSRMSEITFDDTTRAALDAIEKKDGS
jgi:hypothetical protein